MSRTPAEIDEATFDALRPHFTEPQLVELVATIAMENYRARLNRAFGIEAPGLCSIRGVELPVAWQNELAPPSAHSG
ncbi:MAG: hypothetical protein U0360_07980 [Dehalococcoidia bacterium]